MCLSVVARIDQLFTEENEAIVELNGVKKRINMGLLGEEVKEGDWVLVHTGFAIARLEPQKAQEMIQAYMELQEANSQ